MDEKWWICDAQVNGKLIFLGKTYTTFEEIKKHLGPWIDVKGNHVVVFSLPAIWRKRKRITKI